MKKALFGFILGLLICSGIVYATNYLATDITYTPSDKKWEVSNVNEALDNLYSSKNDNPINVDLNVYWMPANSAVSYSIFDCNNCTTFELGTLDCYNKTSSDFNMVITDMTNNQVITEISNQSVNSFNETYAGTKISIPSGCKKLKVFMRTYLANSDYTLSGNKLY